MKSLCLAILCIASAFAGTQASAKSLHTGPLKSVRAHVAGAKGVERAPLKTASSNDIRFSDPYAPPVGAGEKSAPPFPAAVTDAPAPAPQGGFSLTAGRDAPDAPFTGGLKLRF